MNLKGHLKTCSSAFTLVEVIISLAITGVVFGGIIYAYVMATERAEWSAYSLAAQSLAMQKIEQARSAKWDPLGFPPVDELVSSNFQTEVNILDIPISKTNVVYATNFVEVTWVTTNPPLKLIRADCVWNFMGRSVHTNTVQTYRGPDQ